MNTTTVVLTPAHHVASLIANLALHSELPALILEEDRELLQTHPPRRIANSLDVTLSLSIIASYAPVWLQPAK